MAKQTISFGTPPLGIGGDTYKGAFIKCNSNFTELYDSIQAVQSSIVGGNVASATKLQNARTISLTGDASGSVSFDGTKNVSLNVSLSTDPTALAPLPTYSKDAAALPSAWAMGIQNVFVDAGSGFPSYGSVLNMKSYGGGGGTLQIYTPYSPTYGGETLAVRFGNYNSNSGNSWTEFKYLIHDKNIANYAPTKTGAGASGSWGISVTGNAATATKLANARAINGVSFDGTANITVADSTKLPLAGGTITGQLVSPNTLINRVSKVASGISWYSPTYNAWQDYMANGASTGNGVRGNLTAPSGKYVTSWARRSVIEPVGGYGWTFETVSNTGTTPTVVAEISNTGNIRAVGDLEGANLNLSGRVNATQFSSPSAYSFLNGSAAQSIMTGGLLASNAYADASKVPTNGIYSKGKVQADGGFQGNLTGNASSASQVTPQRIPRSADLNSYTTPGEYYCDADADTATMANRPNNLSFSLSVTRAAGCIQTWTNYNGGQNRRYIRGLYSGSWSAWREVAYQDAISKGGQFLGNQETKAIAYNAQNISENVTIPGNVNALSAGPITIDTGKTVIISDGATWTIV